MSMGADNVSELKIRTDAAAPYPKRGVAERSVGRGSGHVSVHGDLRSENADMSNDLSCENHDRRIFKGFYSTVYGVE